MKVIEAMKKIKANKAEIADLQNKIFANSARLSFETPQYGDGQTNKIAEWTQGALDKSRDCIDLLTRISRTNLATIVTIDLGGKAVSKTVAYWVYRRREYAALDLLTIQKQSDRGLKEGGVLPNPSGGPTSTVSIVRYYDPAKRDERMAIFAAEAAAIDAALEVSNAITDLVE